MREQTYSSVHDVTEGLASTPCRVIPLETAPVTCCSLVQMAQAATPGLVTVEAYVRSQYSLLEYVVDKVPLGQILRQDFGVSLQ
jgi:hypothetical protein